MITKHTPTPWAEFLIGILPPWLSAGYDHGQHKTLSDVAFMIRHEMDLFDEGEETDIESPLDRQYAEMYLQIVRAVNSHEALVKLARLVLETYQDAISNDEEINGGDLVDFFANQLIPCATKAIAMAEEQL